MTARCSQLSGAVAFCAAWLCAFAQIGCYRSDAPYEIDSVDTGTGPGPDTETGPGPDTETGPGPDTETGGDTAADTDTVEPPDWITFYGDGDADDLTEAHAVGLDAAGGIYVVGGTDASWDGPDGQPPLHAYTPSGTQDAFVLKLAPDGSYEWHAFFEIPHGGAFDGNPEDDLSLAADAAGNLYVAGTTPSAWDGPGGESPLHAFSPADVGLNLYVLAVDGAGAYRWHTFHGPPGNSDAIGRAIALGEDGNLVVVGRSSVSWDGPGGESPLHAFSGAGSGSHDALVLSLGADGAYRWHAFYGSDDDLAVFAASAAPGAGGAAVAGTARADWDGPGGESPLHAFSEDEGLLQPENLFVLSLDAGGGYGWHTFYPAGGIKRIAVGAGGAPFVSGQASWWVDPDWEGAVGDPPDSGFVAALDPDGGFLWQWFLGQEDGQPQEVVSLACGPGGGVALAGRAYAGTGVVTVGALTANGETQWERRYEGGMAADLAVDADGAAVVVGYGWPSAWSYADGETPLHVGASLNQAFVLRIAP